MTILQILSIDGGGRGEIGNGRGEILGGSSRQGNEGREEGGGPVASAISQIEMERGGGGGFFSRRLTVIRSAFIRV